MTNFILYRNETRALGPFFAVPGLFTVEATAQLTGVHPDLLRYYYRVGLISAQRGMADDDLLFDEVALEELRRIEYYRRHLGVPRRALPLLSQLRRDCRHLNLELRFLDS